MATVTIGRDSRNRLSLEAQQRSERLKATAALYVADVEADRVDRAARCAVGIRETYEQPMAPLPPATREVHSNPDAVEIPKSEIRNFAPLTERDANRFGDAYREAVWGKDLDTGGWAADDVRWTLTPAQLRKMNRRKGGVV